MTERQRRGAARPQLSTGPGRGVRRGVVAGRGTRLVPAAVALLTALASQALSTVPDAVAQAVNAAPVFSEGVSASRSVDENSAAGSAVGAAVSASDVDGDTLTYSLAGSGDGAHFSVDSASGLLLVKGDLDFESKAAYSVAVSVSDCMTALGEAEQAGSCAPDASISVSVSVSDVDEPGEVSFSSAAQVGAVLSASVSDPDAPVSDQVWSWERLESADASDGALLAGVVSASYTPVAADAGKWLRAAVSYSDAHGSSKSASAVTAASVDVPGVVSFSSAPQVGAVLSASVSDPDGSVSGEVWSWERLDKPDASDGALLAGEVSASYTPVAADAGKWLRAAVSYSDGHGSSKAAAVTEAAVVVNAAPVFDEGVSASRAVAENSAAGSAVGAAVSASDGDGDTLTYSLAGSGDGAHFGLDSASGALLVKGALDFESKAAYSVSVSVSDCMTALGVAEQAGSCAPDASIAVSVAVSDVDEPGVVSFSGVAQVGAVLSASVSDPDGSVSSQVWSWERLDKPDASDGALLAGEVSASYTPVAADAGKWLRAAVSYSDGHGSSKEAAAVTEAAVVVNAAPVFDEGVSASRSVAENSAAGSAVGAAVSASDGDGDTLVYSLAASGDGSHFGLDSASGALLVKGALDFESKAAYSVAVAVSDCMTALGVAEQAGSCTPDASIAVSVSVTDVDEPGAVSFSGVGQVGAVLSASVSDPDAPVSDQVWSWERLESADAASGSVLAGEVSASYTPVAADAGKWLRAQVSYSDAHGPATASAVTVASVDVPGVVSFSGVAQVGAVLSASVSDPDGSVSDQVWSWERLESADAASGSVLAGEVSASYTPVAADAGKWLRAAVSYSDGHGSSKEASAVTAAAVVVNAAPVFSEGVSASRSVDENSAAGSAVGAAVSASDVDGDTLVYSLAASGDGAHFALDSASGLLLVSGALDFESKASYSVSVAVSDCMTALGVAEQAGSCTPDASIAVSVSVTDVDELGAVSFSGVAQVAAELSASLSDPDAPVSGAVWSWERLEAKDAADGAVLDGEVSASYTPVDADAGKWLRAAVSYSDGHGSSKEASAVTEAAVVVNAAPVFDEGASASRSVDENSAAGAAVGAAVSASDVDGDTLSYSLAASGDGSHFGVDSASGALLVKGALDFESKASYSVAVVVSDCMTALGVAEQAGSCAPDASIAVSVSVTDVDEPGAVSFSSVPQVGAVLSASVSDPDGSVSGAVWSWERLEAADSASGSVLAGVVSASYTPVAADAGKWLRAEVSYSDAHGSAKEASAVTAASVDEPGVVSFSGVAQVGAVLSASVSDPDGSVSGEVWSWERLDKPDAADGALLAGVVSASYTPVAADAGKWLRAAVSYSDGHGSSKEASAVTAAAVVVNAAPVFSDGASASRAVDENSAAGSAVGAAVSASDVDGDTLVYSLAGSGDGAHFGLDSASGALLVKGDLDFESKASYAVSVSVSDCMTAAGVAEQAGSCAPDASIAVSVSVTDVDEAGEVSFSGVARVSAELSASLADPDAPVSGAVWSWERLDKPDASDGSVLAGEASASYTPVDADAGKWLRAAVSYSDAHGSSKEASAVTAAAVVVNAAPVFSEGASASRSVDENSAAGAAMGAAVSASDADGDVLTYSLAASGDGSHFGLDSASGALLVSGALDFESKASYSVSVSVSDCMTALGVAEQAGSCTPDASIAVSVSVTDVDEPGAVSFSSVPQVGAVLSASLSDPDAPVSGQVWSWERLEAADAASGSVLAGEVSASYTPVAADAGKWLRAAVSYSDGHGSSKSASAVTAAAVGLGMTVSFQYPGYVAFRGDTVTVTVEIAGNSIEEGSEIVVPITQTPEDVSAGDYSGVPASVTFGPGDTEATFTVSAAAGDGDSAEGVVVLGFGTLPEGVKAGDSDATLVYILNELELLRAETAGTQDSSMPFDMDDLNVVWTTHGRDSWDSMPIGNGEIGLNVWVEGNGDLQFFIGKTDSYDENVTLLKLGRIRVALDPNPFATGATFKQELDLDEGKVKISGTAAQRDGTNLVVELEVWVDANHPVIKVEGTSNKDVEVTVTLEDWRKARLLLDRSWNLPQTYKDEGSASSGRDRHDQVSMLWPSGRTTDPNNIKQAIYREPDTVVTGLTDRVIWYHRNRYSRFDWINEFQNLGDWTGEDPLENRTFGAAVLGKGMRSKAGTSDRAISTSRTKSIDIEIFPYTEQTETVAAWLKALQKSITDVRTVPAAVREAKHVKWWENFWNRHWLKVSATDSDASDTAKVAQYYALMRFMLASNARGFDAIHFNGQIFTVDRPSGRHFVHPFIHAGQYRSVSVYNSTWRDFDITPDLRIWGAGHWFQNTRFGYWPFLMSGDFDMMHSLFDMYIDALGYLQHRVKTYYDHAGAVFPETVLFWGAAIPTDYGQDSERRATARSHSRHINTPGHARYGHSESHYGLGFTHGPWKRYHFNGNLELSTMMLDYYLMTQDHEWLKAKGVPFIHEIVTFFYEHYKQSDGTIEITPTQANEAWHDTSESDPMSNSAVHVSGLHAVLDRLLAIPEEHTTTAQRNYWYTVKTSLPPIPLGRDSGKDVIGLAESHPNTGSTHENTELYPAFPFRLYGVGRPDFELIEDTWTHRSNDHQVGGWHQEPIHATMVGKTADAKRNMVRYFLEREIQGSLADDAFRFPIMYGPSHDWLPNVPQPSNAMIALQRMLVQFDGTRILMLPTWPANWDVQFKVSAPYDTTIEGIIKDGTLERFVVDPASRAADVEWFADLKSPPAPDAPVLSLTAPVDGGIFGWAENVSFTVTGTDTDADGNSVVFDCSEVTVTAYLVRGTTETVQTTNTGCTGTFTVASEPSDAATADLTYKVKATYTDSDSLTGEASVVLQPKRKQAEFYTTVSRADSRHYSRTSSNDVGGGQYLNGLLHTGHWSYSPINLTNITAIKIRFSNPSYDGIPAAGTLQIRANAVDGPLLATVDGKISATGTDSSPVWETLPDVTIDTSTLSDPTATIKLFFAPQSTNFGKINWIEFVGAGVSTPP